MMSETFVSALRFRTLTRFYDPVVRLTTREHRFRQEMFERVALAPGQRLLDLACGTGSNISAARDLQPGGRFVGLDLDEEALDRARAKTGRQTGYVRGNATTLPFPDDTFDRVTASLMLHHLDDDRRAFALAEIRRVLRPDGVAHFADWRRGTNPVLRRAFTLVRVLDGFAPTRSHAHESLAPILRVGGFERVDEYMVLTTPLGSIGLAVAEA